MQATIDRVFRSFIVKSPALDHDERGQRPEMAERDAVMLAQRLLGNFKGHVAGRTDLHG